MNEHEPLRSDDQIDHVLIYSSNIVDVEIHRVLPLFFGAFFWGGMGTKAFDTNSPVRVLLR